MIHIHYSTESVNMKWWKSDVLLPPIIQWSNWSRWDIWTRTTSSYVKLWIDYTSIMDINIYQLQVMWSQLWIGYSYIIVKKFVQGVQLVNNCCNRNSKKSYFHLWKFLVFLFMLLFIPSLTNYKSYGTSPDKNKCRI